MNRLYNPINVTGSLQGTSSWSNNFVGFDTYSSSVSYSLNTKVGDSYETVSQNLKDYPKTLLYSGSVVLSVTYSLGDGSYIYKTFIYSGSYITTGSLSGNLPTGIKTKKLTSYGSNGGVISVDYV
jgi:hypothetical protein